ncbi:MAG TPA: discoidin domain-containing protein [Dinghuibacter sp.]|uniref:discoidin domain-containing protein n=1 Tax=Dinghuibacter sp. TaxID=2024697 RepID=UPI002BA3D55E|nr:discoidin domain-containing protein [Dinghuibacter sp.]HTJ14103.1 discoidin domain-containing protein [Dinghuibacter sp.]
MSIRLLLQSGALVACVLLSRYECRGQCNTSYNLALFKTAYCSSTESAAYPASNAFDGSMSSRWSSAFSDPQYIYVDLGATYTLCQVVLYWENAYATAFHIDLSNDASTWTTVATVSGNTSATNTITISGTARYVRMYGTARATGYGYSLYEMQVYGTAASPSCGTNLALGQPATVSSLESAAYPGSDAVDGSMTSRWSSAFSDPQYIYVDLGAVKDVCQVNLFWENAYATAFHIDLSNDAVNWTTVSTISGNTSTTNNIPINANARYVRMYGTSRATGYGYSLYEMQVMGNVIPLPLTFLSFTGSAVPDGALLQWSTAQEVNTSRFDIERSTDGRTFTAIGTVAAQGFATGVTDYTYTDSSGLKGVRYYRLRQWDKNGYSTYSSVVSVSTSPSSSVRLFPNPVADYVNIATPDPIRQVTVYDVAGAPVRTFGSGTQFYCGGLHAGVYLARVVTGKSVSTLKMVKQ